MILLIDNYDSFTYNLYQYIGQFDPNIVVKRNDACTIDEITLLNPDKIVLSPGPKTPEEASICIQTVQAFTGKKPILGVCLGHQAIVAAYGGVVTHAKRLMHGKASRVTHEQRGIFQGLPPVIQVARYHSLAALEETLPECLTVTARSEEGEIMAVCHKEYPVFGVQFHPESVYTPEGLKIIENFVKLF